MPKLRALIVFIVFLFLPMAWAQDFFDPNLARFLRNRERVNIGTASELGNGFLHALAYIGDVSLVIPLVSATKNLSEKREYISSEILKQIMPTDEDHRSPTSNDRNKRFVFYNLLKENYTKHTLEVYLRAHGGLGVDEVYDESKRLIYLQRMAPQDRAIYENLLRNERREIEAKIRALAQRSAVTAVPNEERSIALTNSLEFTKSVIGALSREAANLAGENLLGHPPSTEILDRVTSGLNYCLNQLSGSDSSSYAMTCLQRYSEEVPVRLGREVMVEMLREKLPPDLPEAASRLVLDNSRTVFDRCAWEQYFETPRIREEILRDLSHAQTTQERERLQDRLEHIDRRIQETGSAPTSGQEQSYAKACVYSGILEAVNTASRFSLASQLRRFMTGAPVGNKIHEYEVKLQQCFVSKGLYQRGPPPRAQFNELMRMRVDEFQGHLEECLRDYKRDVGLEIATLQVQNTQQLTESIPAYFEMDSPQGKKYFRQFFRQGQSYLQEISVRTDGTLQLLGRPQPQVPSDQLRPLTTGPTTSPLHEAQRNILDAFVACEQAQELLRPGDFNPLRCAGITQLKGVREGIRAKMREAIASSFSGPENLSKRERIEADLNQRLNCFDQLIQQKLNTLTREINNPLPYVENEAVTCAQGTITGTLATLLEQKIRDTGVPPTLAHSKAQEIIAQLTRDLNAPPRPLTIDRISDRMERFTRNIQRELPRYIIEVKMAEIFPASDNPPRARLAEETPTQYDQYLREQERRRGHGPIRTTLDQVVQRHLDLNLTALRRQQFASAEEESAAYEQALSQVAKNTALLAASQIYFQKAQELIDRDIQGTAQGDLRTQNYLTCLGQITTSPIEIHARACLNGLTPPLEPAMRTLIQQKTDRLKMCLDRSTQGTGPMALKQIKIDRCIAMMSVSFAKSLIVQTLDHINGTQGPGILSAEERASLQRETTQCLNAIYDDIFVSSNPQTHQALTQSYLSCPSSLTRERNPQNISFERAFSVGCTEDYLFTQLLLLPELPQGMGVSEITPRLEACTENLKNRAVSTVRANFIANSLVRTFPQGVPTQQRNLQTQYAGRIFDFFSGLKDSALFPRNGSRPPDGDISRTLLNLGPQMSLAFKYDLNNTGAAFNQLEEQMRTLRQRNPPATKEELASLITNSPFMQQVFKANMAEKIRLILHEKLSTEFPITQFPELYQVVDSITSSTVMDQIFVDNTPTLTELRQRLAGLLAQKAELERDAFQHPHHDQSCGGMMQEAIDCRNGRTFHLPGSCRIESSRSRQLGEVSSEIAGVNLEIARLSVLVELRAALLDFFINGNNQAMQNVEERIKPLVVQALAQERGPTSFTNRLFTGLVNAGIKQHRANLGYFTDNLDRAYLAWYGNDWSASHYSQTHEGISAYNYFVSDIFVGPTLDPSISAAEMQRRITELKRLAKEAIDP